MQRRFEHTYSLKPELRYYYQGLTAFEDASINHCWHFILKLKSIQAYNTTTGKINNFNFWYKSNSKTIIEILGISCNSFKKLLTCCVELNWIVKCKNTYNISSINKINSSLNFKLFKNQKTDREYYTYKLLSNAEGLDLDAHKIDQIIKQTYKHFRYRVEESPNTECRSSANDKLITAVRKKSKAMTNDKRYAKALHMFAISMDTLSRKSGYSKNQVQLLINKMQLQGLEVIKDKSPFDRYVSRECNKYDVDHKLTFIHLPLKKLRKVKPVPVKKKKVILNAVELKFKQSIDLVQNRIDLVNAGIISRNYLKFTKKGLLVSIPKRSWNNILIKLLNSVYKEDFLKFISVENILIRSVEKSAMFTSILNSEERFGTVRVSNISLVDAGGNFNGQSLSNYNDAVTSFQTEYKNQTADASI